MCRDGGEQMTFNSVGDRRSVYTERIKMMRWGIGKVVPTVYALRQSRCSKKNESNTNELHQQTSRYIERKSYTSQRQKIQPFYSSPPFGSCTPF